jgi:hypothetical protein
MRTSGCVGRSNSVSRCHHKAGGLSRLALHRRLIAQIRYRVLRRPETRSVHKFPGLPIRTNGLRNHLTTTDV